MTPAQTALIEKLRAATGPSRELDAEIFVADFVLRHPTFTVPEVWDKEGEIYDFIPYYTRSLDAARAGGHALVLLVGDAPYYARFGFDRVPAGVLALPGPVDPARVLWCELLDGAFARTSGIVLSPRSRQV